jgi:ADP-L-glycero-D-manno-heptose 6-epimerase
VQLFKSYRPDYADGEQMRDFVYVKDAVAVTLYFLDHPRVGGLFNCGSGHVRSWKDLANATFSAMELPAQIEFIEMPAVLRSKYQYFTQAETTNLRSVGYTDSFTSLENAIQDYVATHLAKLESGL